VRLHPASKEVVLYKEGFGDSDLLNRTSVGQRISELVERIEDPMVLAVDGPWGSGKSFFLKRWVGAHTLENGGTATTVYFDAFANDFFEEPLVGLTGAIGERLPKGKPQRSLKKVKKVVYKVAGPVARIGAAVATAGATELAGPILDAVIEAGGKEAQNAADAFWKREDGRRAAIQQFRSALCEITEDGKPLVIVVDELDRCRPDYALAVLEVIKHFFAAERVHFVLGVNLDALEDMVRIRYGANINAGDYLKRFISLSLSLPNNLGGDLSANASVHYFQVTAREMGIEPRLIDVATDQLKMAVTATPVSLRDIEKVLIRFALLPRRKDFERTYVGYQALIVSLTLFQVLKPDLFRRAFRRSLKIGDIQTFFGMTQSTLDENSEAYDRDASFLRGLWQFALTSTVDVESEKPHFARAFNGRVRAVFETIERDYFALFEINETA